MGLPAKQLDSEVDINLPRKLLPLLNPKRFKIVIGGRGGGKSVSFANLFSMYATGSDLIGCFREYQNSIADSVHSLLKKQISDLNIPGFYVTKKEIEHRSGGGFRFKGLSRSLDAVKSMHGFRLFWVEEGQFMAKDSIKTLTPTLREAGSELWVSANPMSSADPFSQRFIMPYQKELVRDGIYEDKLHLIIVVNWRDNPWFPDDLELERQHDYNTLSRALYDHVWEGAFNDEVEDSIIKTEWFDACINAHEKLGFKAEGYKVTSHDPSDMGTDDKGLVERHGSVITMAQSRAFGEVNDGMDWALDSAINSNSDMFIWDADGLGAGLKRQAEKATKGKVLKFKMFHGGETAERPHDIYEPLDETDHKNEKTNKEHFKNRRAQHYWYLRDRMYATYIAVEKGKYTDPDTMISLSSEIEDLQLLRSEVCRIPRKYNTQGKIQILSKDEMRRLKIQSPNLADSLMMSLTAPEVVEEDDGGMVFDNFFD